MDLRNSYFLYIQLNELDNLIVDFMALNIAVIYPTNRLNQLIAKTCNSQPEMFRGHISKRKINYLG